MRGRETTPSTLIGAGLVEEGRIAISLGTSDTVFGPMSEPRVNAHMLARNEATRWADVIAGLAEPLANSRVDPDPDRHFLYRDMVPVYAACEAHALGRGPDPGQRLEHFRHRAQ